MILVELLQQAIALGQGILGHFVDGSAGTAYLLGDYEWNLGDGTPFALSTKGQYLSGAIADIVTYGAILVDWIVQSMLNTTVELNDATP